LRDIVPRKPRIEIAGGLYHVITRGNNRRRIFRSRDDFIKFTKILVQQKAKVPFYLYAYCLMPNHVHLLVEMQEDKISRIMQRVLTAYSHYYNRKYARVGHLFQGRYKSSLCETSQYLAELVRYIHLNPVRAKLVERPEQYEFSGHQAYLGLDKSGLVDVEPVLRHFGGRRKRAIEVYCQFLAAGIGQRSGTDFYKANKAAVLGNEEFLEEIKHRVGEFRARRVELRRISIDDLIRSAERISGLSRLEVCGKSRNRRTVAAREAVIVVGREFGMSNRELAEGLRIDASAVTRRIDAARARECELIEVSRLRKALGQKKSRGKHKNAELKTEAKSD
jgi:REP element-mobilizing transposase RayT